LFSVDFTLFTQPKTGTHLLIPILVTLTGKSVSWAPKYTKTGEPIPENYEFNLEDPGQIAFSVAYLPWKVEILDLIWKRNEKKGAFLHLHPPYSPVLERYLMEKGCINFFVKRDPRDQVVSLLNHYKYIKLEDKSLAAISSDEERLLFMIQKDLRRQTLLFMGWLKSPVCCVLDFSKLMGAHGGVATNLDALEEMRKIASALELDCSDECLAQVYQKDFGRGWSFFRGKVGAWKAYFNEKHKTAAKQAIGDLLIELGYEEDCNW
jgi:hypothetical protein